MKAVKVGEALTAKLAVLMNVHLLLQAPKILSCLHLGMHNASSRHGRHLLDPTG